jgi:hypothetical protein
LVKKGLEMKTFDEVFVNDPTVYNLLNSGGTARECIVALANEKAELIKKIVDLEMIVPKKYKLPDGKIVIWHCPDDLIPMKEITGINVKE